MKDGAAMGRSAFLSPAVLVLWRMELLPGLALMTAGGLLAGFTGPWFLWITGLP